MKKLLLGSTALAACTLASMPAMAELTLTLSGYYRFDAAYVSETNSGQVGTPTLGNPFATSTVNTRNYDFASRARIAFDAAGTADNGLRYGARIRFQNSFGTSNNLGVYDQAYGFVQGAFGRLAFGDIESAGSLLRIYAPDNAGTGMANGTWANFQRGVSNQTQRVPFGAIGGPYNSFSGGTTPAGFGGFNLNRFGANPNASFFDDVFEGSTSGNSYSTKLVYTTTGIPLYGFTFGVSFAPEIGNRGRNYDRDACDPTIGTCTSQAAAPNFEDAISVALQYANTNIWNSVGFKAAGQMNWANSRNNNVKDLFAWMLGAQFTYAGFTLGGSYIDNTNTGSVTGGGVSNLTAPGYFGTGIAYGSYAGYNLGLEYTVGPWTVGANYFTQYVDRISANVPFTSYQLESAGAGASYVVAPGLTVGADVVYYWEDIDRRAGTVPVNENSGTIVAVRTQVTF